MSNPQSGNVHSILDQVYISDSVSIENIPPDESVLRRPAVKARTGLSDTGIDERIALGTFPKSIFLGGRARGWIGSDIVLWILKRVIISNDPTATKAETDMRTAYLANRKGQIDSDESGARASG
jgi:prophage regulatory protein